MKIWKQSLLRREPFGQCVRVTWARCAQEREDEQGRGHVTLVGHAQPLECDWEKAMQSLG